MIDPDLFGVTIALLLWAPMAWWMMRRRAAGREPAAPLLDEARDWQSRFDAWQREQRAPVVFGLEPMVPPRIDNEIGAVQYRGARDAAGMANIPSGSSNPAGLSAFSPRREERESDAPQYVAHIRIR